MYVRNKENQLLIGRTAILLIIVSIVQTLGIHLYDYAILLTLTASILSVFPITTLSITHDQLSVTRYYLLGLLPFTEKFTRDNIVEIHVLKEHYEEEHASVESDTWLDIIGIFIPKRKGVGYLLKIKQRVRNERYQRFYMHLTPDEYKLISDFENHFLI